MKKIGIKNFRRFADLQKLEFGNINFFVGCNNSGKSTVGKAILLLFANLERLLHREYGKDLLHTFNFAPDAYHRALHIGSFSRAVNIDNKNDPIYFEVDFGFDYSLEIEIGKNDNSDLPTSPIKQLIIKDKINEAKYTIDYEGKTVCFDIPKGIKSLNDKGRVSFFNHEMLKRIYANINQLQQERENNQKLILELQKNLESSKKDYSTDIIRTEESLKIALINKMRNDQNLTELIKTEKIIEQSLNQKYDIDPKIFITVPFSELPVRMPFVNATVEDIRIRSFFYNVKTNKLESSKYKNNENYKYISSLDDYFRRMIRSLNAVPGIDYIYAHSISQDTFYKINDRNDYMAQTIQDFYDLDLCDESNEKKFVISWMRKFGIGLDYKITPIDGNEGFYVKIEKNPRTWINLAENGIGSVQLMLLLFKIAYFINNNVRLNKSDTFACPLILIEEPEQNLHPSLQAQLTDFFYEISNTYKIRFVVETHSEYLIRRAQSIVAESNFSEIDFQRVNPFKVFYFPEKGSVYDMDMTPTGRFNNSFDEGFFDVAAKLNMKVFAAERQKNNV